MIKFKLRSYYRTQQRCKSDLVDIKYSSLIKKNVNCLTISFNHYVQAEKI